MKSSSCQSSTQLSFAALLWPQLLVGTRLALRPARIAMAMVLLLLLSLLVKLPDLWLAKDATPSFAIHAYSSESLETIIAGFLTLDLSRVFEGVRTLFITLPTALVEHHLWSLLAVAGPILLAWAVLGGAITRSAAEEFSRNTRQPWTASLAFALSRPWSLFFSLVAPLALAGGLALAIAVAGYVLLRVPGVNIAGGAAYGSLLLGGFLLLLVILALVIGQVLLIPAAACEGVDAIDATQRTYAYSLGRPVRTAFYLLVLLLQGLLLAAVLTFVVTNVIHLTAELAGAWLPDAQREVVHSASTSRSATVGDDAPFGLGATSHLVSLWSAIPGLIAGAILLSYYFSGSSIMYLLLRKVCDGQDPADLWFPGSAAGTITETSDEANENGANEPGEAAETRSANE